MRLRHIEIFQAIRQTGSISAAAQLLHVSQPAVTKVLQHAELQLGFALFLRVRGKLQPTPEALALESEVEKVTASLQGVRRLAKSLRHMPGQSIRIGAIPALALSLLPPAILEWTRDYPDMACELSSDHSRELVQKLLMREIDLALTLNFSGHPGLTAQVLANVAAKLGSYLENIDPPPRVTISVQTYSLARAMVESGAGLTVIDPFTALGASTATTRIRTLTPPLPITLYALTRANEPPPHMLARLLEIFGNRACELLARL
ncbi:MAG: LysR family transcriptional regulator [Pseudomonas orientalis]|nr:LysR family transcriptional regulator [Pseudomonas orientalis]